jgi:hypothetical protein
VPAAQRLSDEDLSILALENATVAGHTCKVILVQGQLDPAQLRSSVARRLDRAPRLRLRLADRDGEPWWVPDPDLDLSAHVVESGRAGAGDEAGLRAAVAGIFAQHLDRSRPLWRIDVLPRLAGRPVVAMYSLAEIGAHHALRIAVVSLAGTLNFGLVADPTLLDDVDQLAAGLDAEAAALTACLPPG